MRSLGLGMVALALAGQAAAADEPLVLKPTSNWQVDYAEDKCRLARKFGEGDTLTVVMFEQDGPSERFGMTFGG